MSGIFTYIGPHDPNTIASCMATRMRHLDHIQTDYILPHPSVMIGRLHIGLLNRTPQPITSADGTITLCLCGEFYHQDERRRAYGLLPSARDEELALMLYQTGGVMALTQLEGAFTIVLWDTTREELCIVNDRFGLYPHYYCHTGQSLIAAPEIKGILCAPEVARTLDHIAIAQMFRFQQLLGSRTWVEGVHLLPPATLLRFRMRDNTLRLQRYWDWNSIARQTRISLNEAVEEAYRLLQRAVTTMSAPPLRPGVYLSGGYDGRIILGCFGGRKVPTFTFGDAQCRDVIYARAIARAAGTTNTWFDLDREGRWLLAYTDLHRALTEGLHSFIHAHGISTLATVRKSIDVNLSGWDGEVTLAGEVICSEDPHGDRYYRYAPDDTTLRDRLFTAFCQHLTWPGITDDEAAMLELPNGVAIRQLAHDSFAEVFASYLNYPLDQRIDYLILEQCVRRSLQNQIVTARSHIEVRCPYFDYTLVEFMYSLPEEIRTNPFLRREIITRYMPRLALIPRDSHNRLPHTNPVIYHSHALLQRGKSWINRRIAPLFPERTRLYADYETYLRTGVCAWAEAILFDKRTLARGIVNPVMLQQLWERHQRGHELWTIGKIAAPITLELIIRELIEEAP